jgi:DNA modification methylase
MIIEKKQIVDLIPAPYNPRQSTAKQEKHLKESLEKFGMVEPIIFNKQTGYIVGGHFRVRELKKLGIKEIECVIVDLNEADEKELNIRLNANTGSWDWDTLANDWDVVDLEAWGLEIPQFDNEAEELEASEDNYDVPEGGIETDIVIGDLFEIGEHRLLCGDSTDSDQVARLMNGEKADMVFTDPPYGIDWNTDYTRFTGGLIPSENKYNKIHDDEKAFDPSFLLATHENCLFFGANCFSDKLPKGNWIVWDKRFENGKAFLADAEVAWYNGSGAVYIIAETHQGFVSSDKKRFHPTQKPIKLLEKIFEKINAPNFLFDPYLGSGSTMVAAHQLKRRCFGLELEPKYCQVIIDRMRKLDSSLIIKRNGIEIKTAH